jgi:hypothetical protein
MGGAKRGEQRRGRNFWQRRRARKMARCRVSGSEIVARLDFLILNV